VAIIRYLYHPDDSSTDDTHSKKIHKNPFVKIMNESEFNKIMEQKTTAKEWQSIESI
jgi:hypothetical protein